MNDMLMTWEQKLQALQSLADCELHMRRPGDWFVNQRVQIGGNGLLTGSYGNGATPEKAVEDHWKVLTNLDLDQYLVISASSIRERQHVRWNGFMWEALPVQQRATAGT